MDFLGPIQMPIYWPIMDQ